MSPNAHLLPPLQLSTLLYETQPDKNPGDDEIGACKVKQDPMMGLHAPSHLSPSAREHKSAGNGLRELAASPDEMRHLANTLHIAPLPCQSPGNSGDHTFLQLDGGTQDVLRVYPKRG